MNKHQIHAVPTNIITGFLGVGKTSAIMHLLKQKPKAERWAILVNEFGEIGIDGSLFKGQQSEEQGFFIREVPGGCMCCAAGVPMQVALNQLLLKAKPDRLLIEPTGLGHPLEVLQVLKSEHYKESLLLQKTITLVDARKLTDLRYTSHDTFNQQIAMADIIIGNKLDLYQGEDQANLLAYVKAIGKASAQIEFTQQGEIDLSLLQGSNLTDSVAAASHHHSHDSQTLAADLPIPECGFIKATNQGEGFSSIGWRFSADKIFNHRRLFSFLADLKVERMKGSFITDNGLIGYNLTTDALTATDLQECLESRIEIIADSIRDDLEVELLSCLDS
ncbi:CobW family GTP-binding protein [Reinekea sp.]|jgi:G3E family GTPase|uniref:CobW family GTP-binding protein n=1 Tax=Reinekea sp. TaxID=1970455 RepID=UPI0039894E93